MIRNPVVDHEGKVLLALLPCPSDECRAGRAPRGRTSRAWRASVAVVDGKRIWADQGTYTEIVVAGDELVPELALASAAHTSWRIDRTDLVEHGAQRPLPPAHRRSARAGSAVPAAGRAIAVPVHGHGDLAIMDGRCRLNQVMRRQNPSATFNGGDPAIRRFSAISPAVKSRPRITALDPPVTPAP